MLFALLRMVWSDLSKLSYLLTIVIWCFQLWTNMCTLLVTLVFVSSKKKFWIPPPVLNKFFYAYCIWKLEETPESAVFQIREGSQVKILTRLATWPNKFNGKPLRILVRPTSIDPLQFLIDDLAFKTNVEPWSVLMPHLCLLTGVMLTTRVQYVEMRFMETKTIG